MQVALQMDDIAAIDIRGDTSFALALEAQARGFELFYYLASQLSLEGGRVAAPLAPLTVKDERHAHFTLGAAQQTDLQNMDVVLARQDPPFDMAYITATHLLEKIHPKTLVVNNPAAVRNMPEKLFVLNFPELIPPTLISRDVAAIKNFREQHRDIILKPLYGNGGAGVFLLRENDENFSALIEWFLAATREPFIAQAYLDAVRVGDKRLILIDGEAAGALNRIPQAGEVRANMHVGGTPAACALDERDYEIAAAIGGPLREAGIILAGADIIGGKLTEINITSPTGIREIKNLGGVDLAVLFWDKVLEKINNN